MKKAFLFVNGILNRPGSADGWTDRAVTWVHNHTDAYGEKFEYCAGALTRRILQARRARAYAALANAYAGMDSINLVGHSNGGDIILRALPDITVSLDTLHFISAAAGSDFKKNGLNAALVSGQVKRVVVWMAGRDAALPQARLSQRLLGWLGLGYEDLGLTGPLHVATPERVFVIQENAFGHSTWFDAPHFALTMRRLTGESF